MRLIDLEYWSPTDIDIRESSLFFCSWITMVLTRVGIWLMMTGGIMRQGEAFVLNDWALTEFPAKSSNLGKLQGEYQQTSYS